MAGSFGEYEWELQIYAYADTGENPYSVELGELTGIELLQVDMAISWGEPPRDQTRTFSTVKAVLTNRELP